jgi:hypothetical protein
MGKATARKNYTTPQGKTHVNDPKRGRTPLHSSVQNATLRRRQEAQKKAQATIRKGDDNA